MKALYDEMTRRFPEIQDNLDWDRDLPYMLMHHLTEWLATLSPSQMTPQLKQRLVSFWYWCLAQPRGVDAGDDLLTIWTVGFYEDLFKADVTCKLVPLFGTRAEYMINADYLRNWIGAENYAKVLAHFPLPRRRKSRS